MGIKIQCKDNQGKIGSFIVDKEGTQISKTYRDLVELFSSKEYKNGGNND